jgi:hypothetical protein
MPVVVFLDTCRSGFGALQVQEALTRALMANGRSPDIGVLASCLPLEKSGDGEFGEQLVKAIRDGSENHWRDTDSYIPLIKLRNELRDRLGDEQYAVSAGNDGLDVIPNPRAERDAPERPLESYAVLAQLPADDRRHFLQMAAGADLGDVGWFFSGRVEVSREVVTWLRYHQRGLVVVTGAPGSGKSAFLGRLAILADRGSQGAIQRLQLRANASDGTVPTVGSFDVVLPLRARTAEHVAAELMEKLGLKVPEGADSCDCLPKELTTERLERLRRRFRDDEAGLTILADGLDEAYSGVEAYHIVVEILRPLVERGCRVIVGTRPDWDGRWRPRSDRHGPLLRDLLGDGLDTLVVDLSDQLDSTSDIYRYVLSRLEKLRTTWPTRSRREEAAAVVSEQAKGNFLYARFALRGLSGKSEDITLIPGWRHGLPADASDAGLREFLEADLRRFGEDEAMVTDVLTALAYAEGNGLSYALWPKLASDLSCHGYAASDVARVIRLAGWYLIEGMEEERSVFRLYHQSMADHLRDRRNTHERGAES